MSTENPSDFTSADVPQRGRRVVALESLARARGLTVFARIDFSSDAARSGLTMRRLGLCYSGVRRQAHR